MKKMTRRGLFLAVVVCAAMLMAFAASAATLSDIQNHWAKEYIEFGVEKGYISGYADGTFLPDKTVTRAEFSKMINNAVGITSTGTAKGAFSDVASSEWYFNEVKKAENAGYITGYEDGSFRPSNTVTRQEAAVILSRLVIPTSSRADITTFGDGKTVDTWATDAVSMIAFKGYIKGDENGNFIPKGQLTRSQAAKLICEFVKNENIANGNQTTTSVEGNEVVFSETLFTDGVTVNVKGGAEITVNFKNCRVLGDVTISTEKAYVKLDNSKLGNFNLKAADVAVEANRSASVKHTYVYYPATLDGEIFNNVTITGTTVGGQTVAIDGTCQTLNVSADVLLNATTVKTLNVTGKSNLVIQQADIDVLNVESAAKGSAINLLTNKAQVDTANNKAAVTYTGTGTIQTANNEVTGVEFNGVTVKKVNGKGAVTEETVEGFFKDVTFSPANKATDAGATDNVVITFKQKVLDKDGEALTAAYLKSNIELRKASASGTKVAFVATISSNKKITLNPSSNLSDGMKYYVVIPAGVLTYEDGTENEKYSMYFTVGGDGEDENDDEFFEDVTVSPKNKESGVEEDENIVFTFEDEVFDKDGEDLTSAYVKSNFQLRKSSASGTKVTFTATVASTGKKITLNPSSDLSDGKYYVIIPAGALTYDDGSENLKYTMYFTVGEEEDESDEFLGMEVSPEKGDTKVPVNSNIIFNFDDEVFDEDNDDMDEDYVEDTFEIRKSTTSGTKVKFTATVSTNGKKITLNPTSDLAEKTKYYVIIPKGALTDEDENENDKYTTYFTTGSEEDEEEEEEEDLFAGLSVSPKHKGEASTLTQNIVFTFKEEVFDDGEDELEPDYVEEYFELRKDSVNGTKVAFTAAVASTNRKITLNPDASLVKATKYYVIIPEGALTNEDGDENDEYVMYFTTAGYKRNAAEFFNDVEVSPEDEEENVSVSSNISLTFAEKILDDGKDTISTTYIKENFELRKGSETGEKLTFGASISKDKTVLTLNPSSNFVEAEIYYLIIPANTLRYEDGTKNPEFVVSFSTKNYIAEEDKPKITSLKAENITTETFDVVVTASCNGKVTVYVDNEAVGDAVDCTAGEAVTIYVTGLTENTGYSVKAEVVDSNNLKASKTISAKTEAEPDNSCPDCGKDDCTDTTGKYCDDCEIHGHEETDHCEDCGELNCTDTTGKYCAKEGCEEHGHEESDHCEDCGELNCTDTTGKYCEDCEIHGHEETDHCEDCGEVNCTDTTGKYCEDCEIHGHEETDHCEDCGEIDCTDTTGKYCAKDGCKTHGHDETDHCEDCGEIDCTDTTGKYCAKEGCETHGHEETDHCEDCGELGCTEEHTTE